MKKRPYWLTAGPETCECCHFTHVREVEVRCTGCDRGFCQHCIVFVRETREWLCAGCQSASEEDA